jgi:hypothetical protein
LICDFRRETAVRVPNNPCVLVAGLCDETDPEYELRFAADEEYIRELIDRVDKMSLRGVKLCNRCTEKHSRIELVDLEGSADSARRARHRERGAATGG